MALCSQAISATATKRGCQSLSNIYSTPNKRICLTNGKVPTIGGIGFKDFYYSSSSEEDDSEDEEHASFESIQMRKKLIPRRSSVALAITGSETEIENFDCQQISQDEGADQNNNNAVPIADTKARARCFEYLIGAIDEAWARYCDAAASVEDDVYGYSTNSRNVAVSDDEEDDDASVDDDTFDNSTDITDYSDFPSHHHLSSTSPIKPQPQAQQQQNQSSNQLQDLKVRLTKAKYYLQELVDSNDYREIELFWKRWDMIKYSTIELVEDDDDDEIIESTIEELENGRLFL